MAKIHKDILKLLAEEPLSLPELAEKLEKSEKKVYNALKKLFGDGEISSNAQTRKYSLSK
jgi:predicted transcriptional regulator